MEVSLRSDLYERPIRIVPDNRPPTSIFSLTPNPLELNSGKLANYKDSSYDIDGHPLINYSWKLEKLSENGDVTNSWQLAYAPTDFAAYGVGKYRVNQTVFDSPPPPLQSLSDTSMITFEVIPGKQKPYPVITYTPDQPIEGKDIQLSSDKSFDLDGTVVGWSWKITNPSGVNTTSTTKNPLISSAMKGKYLVELTVTDNHGLESDTDKKKF